MITIGYLIHRYFSLPTMVGFMMVFQYALYICIAVYYAILSLPNPLIDSNNGVFHGSFVHPISWVFVFIFIIYARMRLPIYSDKVNRVSSTHKAWPYLACLYNSLLIILLGAFLLCISEFSWEIAVTYWWYSTGQMNGITISNFTLTYGFVLTGAGLLTNLWVRNYQYFNRLWIVPVFLGLLMIFWLGIGFPLSTRTGMLEDLTPNIIEVIGHWGIPSALFVVLFKK